MIAISDRSEHSHLARNLRRLPLFGRRERIACRIVESLVTWEVRYCQSLLRTMRPRVSSLPWGEVAIGGACPKVARCWKVVVALLGTMAVTRPDLIAELHRTFLCSPEAITKTAGSRHREKHRPDNPRTRIISLEVCFKQGRQRGVGRNTNHEIL